MFKTRKKTYGSLSRSLKELGFMAIKRGDTIIFEHPSGRPMIALPVYKTGAAVSPIHLMMVRKQLTDAGLILDEHVADQIPAKSRKTRVPDLKSNP